MLVLTRKEGQGILVGSGKYAVYLQVQKLHGNRVRLAIDAHEDVPILRDEVMEGSKEQDGTTD